MRNLKKRIQRPEAHQPSDGRAVCLEYDDGYIKWGDTVYSNRTEMEADCKRLGRWPKLILECYRDYESCRQEELLMTMAHRETGKPA